MNRTDKIGNSVSEQGIIDWLRQRLRTLGWDAWMAFDRNTANSALLTHHQEGKGLAGVGQISGVIDLGLGTYWEHLYGCKLDAPSISFEDSSLAHARVRVTTPLMTGALISVDQSSGRKRVVKIERYSPLLGPSLVGELSLHALEGAEGRVIGVDLGDTEVNYQFTVDHYYAGQRKGGDFFKAHFKSVEASSLKCAVALLGNGDGDALTPGVVVPRGYPEPGSDQGGAVVLFIASEDSPAGSLPVDESNWIYPIPSGYQSTLVMGNRTLMHRVFPKEIADVVPDAEFSFDLPEDPNLPMNDFSVVDGHLHSGVIERGDISPFARVTYHFDAQITDLAVDGSGLRVERAEDGLKIRFRSGTFSSASMPLLKTEGPDGSTVLDYCWQIRRKVTFSASEAGELIVIPDTNASANWSQGAYRQGQALAAEHYHHFRMLEARMGEELTEQLSLDLTPVLSRSIEQFRLKGVVYPGDRAMQFVKVVQPMDLVMFGRVGPAPDAFAVSPAQGAVLAGSTLQFSTVPAAADVSWGVEAVDGQADSPGSISSSGLYSAPGPDALFDGFRRVKVTASSGAHQHSVVVSVVENSVVLNPLVFIASAGSPEVKLSAGAVDGTSLEWSVESASGATLQPLVPEPGAIVNESDRLYVYGGAPTGGLYSVDRVTVAHTASGQSASAPVLVVETETAGGIMIVPNPELPPEQIQLEFNGGQGPLRGVVWEVLAGSGSIDSEGVFTQVVDPSQPFAVITAVLDIPDVMTLTNYIVLPIPLIDLEEVQRILS